MYDLIFFSILHILLKIFNLNIPRNILNYSSKYVEFDLCIEIDEKIYILDKIILDNFNKKFNVKI